MLLANARIHQILFLFLFLVLGVGTRDWTVQPERVGAIMLTCVAVQWVALAVSDRQTPSKNQFVNALPSALITALGLSLLLRADHYGTLILASTAAILSKFLLRIQGKHVFNPANFGIIVALILTSDAWVSPGQWGEEGWYALLFLGAGGVVLRQVGRWDTSVTFLAAYAGLEAVRNIWLGWSWDVWGHRLSSGSLLLFALFMITDPRTIPNARISRMVWAIAIALLTFILRNTFFVSTAAFWALFALAPLSVLLDILFPAARFMWAERSSAPDSLPTQSLQDNHEILTDSGDGSTGLPDLASIHSQS